MTTITKQVRDLDALSATELASRYEALLGTEPRVRNRAFLRRQVAWKLQECALGGLSNRATARLDELIAGLDVPLLGRQTPRRAPQTTRGARNPIVGTTLTRHYKGNEIRVEVRDNGFEHNGTLYRSLTAVAKAVTGSAWNGKLFFGLTSRRKTQ